MDEKSPPLSPTLPGEVSALSLATFPFRRFSILLLASSVCISMISSFRDKRNTGGEEIPLHSRADASQSQKTLLPLEKKKFFLGYGAPLAMRRSRFL